MDRKAYWNENYYQYWKSRVDEADGSENTSNVIEGDPRTEGDQVYLDLTSEVPFRKGKILEVGCAWGRLFSHYKELDLEIYGVDISQAMIDAALKEHGDEDSIKFLEVAEAEKLPFENDQFDNLACFAVFDATWQSEALAEFTRVLAPKGQLYLTGKNNLYMDDDEEAMAAEIGARKKGHPNYFTDTPLLIQSMQENGFELLSAYFFLRRGDFAQQIYSREIPERFYEYFLIFRKTKLTSNYRFEGLASEFSQNFLQKKEQ